VDKLTSVLNTINSLTGVNRRHNLALRDVTDWLATMKEFLSRYRLTEESNNFDSIIKNIGEAKFDLTNITYRTGDIIKTAHKVKGAMISPIIEKILQVLEGIRRALINPTLSRTIIEKHMFELHEALRQLQDAISGIEYK
jgi:hypothetical protein